MPKTKSQEPAPPSYSKLNILTMGGKGGTGKTTFILTLIEWFEAKQIPVVLRDLDIENQGKGGLKYYHDAAEKINVHRRDALDVFFDTADIEQSIVIADMGAGQGEPAMKWFAEASDQAKELGIGFLCVGVINNDPASVASVLQWADQLKDRVRYWIIQNEMQEPGSQFEYWNDSEAVAKFVETYHPAITRMRSRNATLQGHLADHRVSLLSIAQKRSKDSEMRHSRWVSAAQRYLRQLFEEFDEVVPAFLPDV